MRRYRSIRFAAVVAIAGGIAASQDFEAATIKPVAPPESRTRPGCTGGPGTRDPGLLTCENFSLSFLVMMAYNLRSFQFSGPGWMDTERYHVAARIPAGTTLPQFRTMLQHLLADRFHLAAHTKSIEGGAYELTVASGGAELAKSPEGAEAQDPTVWMPPPAGPPIRTRVSRRAVNQSMAAIAMFLADQLGRPVKDATGLTGSYDYTLTWMADPAGRGGPAVDVPEGDPGSTLEQAVRDQLGLRLTLRKGPVEILVVDRAEKL
jgi:uncharacterized protein (TIGR03435 family)